MIKMSNIRGRYADFTLVTRTVNCSTITSDEFIEALKTDINNAVTLYRAESFPKQQERMLELRKKYHHSQIEDAMKYAEKRWKTEKRRNKYVADFIKELNEKEANYKPYISDLAFFDFDGNCGTEMGINSSCVLDVDASDKEIANCFGVLKNTKYFNNAIGWELGYSGDVNTYRSSFRPYIKLVFDDEVTDAVTDSKEKLTKAVSDFYKNTTYFGD